MSKFRRGEAVVFKDYDHQKIGYVCSEGLGYYFVEYYTDLPRGDHPVIYLVDNRKVRKPTPLELLADTSR